MTRETRKLEAARNDTLLRAFACSTAVTLSLMLPPAGNPSSCPFLMLIVLRNAFKGVVQVIESRELFLLKI